MIQCCFLLLSIYITHFLDGVLKQVHLTTVFQPVKFLESDSFKMQFFTLLVTLGLALPGVHSIPTSSKSFSEVASASESLNAARALPDGDLYPPQPPGAGPGKRGLLYNSESNVGWSNFYVESPYVTYGSNGGLIRGDEINTWFSYVPTLAVDARLENSDWDDIVPVLIEGGTKALFAQVLPTTNSVPQFLLSRYTARMNLTTHGMLISRPPNVSRSTKGSCSPTTVPSNSALLPSPTMEVRQA